MLGSRYQPPGSNISSHSANASVLSYKSALAHLVSDAKLNEYSETLKKRTIKPIKTKEIVGLLGATANAVPYAGAALQKLVEQIYQRYESCIENPIVIARVVRRLFKLRVTKVLINISGTRYWL
jgi:predicted transcriptional regulator